MTDALVAVAPALGFLCAAVPLAVLLEKIGFFEAVAQFGALRGRAVSVGSLWLVAAATTVVLNLDATVVLLTPIYVRLARRSGVDPLPVALVPLLLASLASSVLPVSNLTTLIVVERLGMSSFEVLVHLGPPTIAAVAVGWLAYRGRHRRYLPAAPVEVPDPRALRAGGAVVAVLLVGFVIGPSVGVHAWMVAVAGDVALIALTRTFPWRSIPLVTSAVVAVVVAAVAAVAPSNAPDRLASVHGHLALAATVGIGAGAANLVNNLPATLAVVPSTGGASAGLWAWLVGVNVGAVLLPVGALANILWLRVLGADGIAVTWRTYVRSVAPVALPALAAAAVVAGFRS
ncbi:MAG: SLC13 family permease [Acidimicrobiales bacterium]